MARIIGKQVLREVGRRLREYREAAGLTQLAVAEAIGVEAVTVRRWELGIREPSEVNLGKLGKLYGVQVIDMLPATESGELREVQLVGVPIVGAISAGGLVEGWQSDLGTIGVPGEWLRLAPRAFALKVSGNSLLADGITEGDVVIVDPEAPFVDGKIYAVRSEEHNETVTARHVYLVGARRFKLVSGDGEITEVLRSRTEILGRIRWSMREH